MPPRVMRKSAAAAAKKIKSTKETEEKEETEEMEEAQENEAKMIEIKPVKKIFEEFKTSAPLEEGLCVVRKLENGKYEMLNLSSLDSSVLGSLDFGRLVRDDESGGRLKALEGVQKAWKDAELGVGQALSSSNLRIFRFLKLPIELRYKIYDYTISNPSPKPLLYAGYRGDFEQKRLGLQLRTTCRDIYEETRCFFWRNNFRISDFNKSFKIDRHVLAQNLREITWVWMDFKIKDPQTLSGLKTCKQLKVFHLVLTQYAVMDEGDAQYSKRQYSYQDEPAVAKFRRTNGFDLLLSFRGLETVTVENKPARITDEEFQAFESFLRQELTKPQPQPLITEAFSKASKKKTKSKKKSTKPGDSDEWTP